MLGLVGAVVWTLVGLVGMLDLSADGETTPQATTAGATPSPSPSAAEPDEDSPTRAERRAAARAARAEEKKALDALAEPTGSCAAGDVVVTPSVPDGHAGSEVTVVLELTTLTSPACTWNVDPDDLFVTIAEKSTTLWSSQHCPNALPTTTAVPRRTTPDEIRFTWNAKESVPGCSVATSWVWPGVYQVTAVARGSVNPVETLFTLGDPETQSSAEPEKADRNERGERAGDPRADEAGNEPDSEAAGSEATEAEPEPETAAEAAERREKRREALREARRQHRQDQRAESDAG